MDPITIQNQQDLNEWLKKSITLNDLASGGRLNREQSSAFIDLGVDRTRALAPGSGISRINANALRGEVDIFDICDYTVRGTSENTSSTATSCDTDQRKPTFGKVNYDLQPVTQDWGVTYHAVKDNIEREGIRNTINNAMATKWGNEIEELFWRGDVATWSALNTNQAKLLKVLNGIIVQAQDCTAICDTTVHTTDVAGSTITTALFKRLVRRLPEKYSSNVGGLKFFAHPFVASDYRYWQSTRATDLGDRRMEGLLSGVTPLGIDLIEMPLMPVDMTGNNNYIIVTFPGNMWYAVLEDIRRYVRYDQHCDKYFYTNHYFFDCGIYNCDAMAILTGLKLRSD